MKRMILVLVAGWMLSGCAGVMPVPQEEMKVQKVVEVPGVSKDKLFDRSRMWYAESFRKANSVIQYENKENGTIMGNGFISISELGASRDLRISIETEVKDSKSRITVLGMSLSDPKFGEMAVQKRYWDEFKEQIFVMMGTYEQYLKGPVPTLKTDNW